MDHIELKKLVLNYYKDKQVSDDISSMLNIIRTTDEWVKIVFPYDWVDTITSDRVIPELIPGGLYCDFHLESAPEFKLRFPIRDSDDMWYRHFYIQLCAIEQAIYSPHRYLPVPKNCSVIDVGASEGLFGFLHGDPSNEFHMFDEPMWKDCAIYNLAQRGIQDAYFYPQYIEVGSALPCTFNKPLGCIKIDVDGPELDILEALSPYIEQYNPMLQVAVYHYDSECTEVIHWIQSRGYNDINVSDGFMLYPNDDNQVAPYFRRGLVFASKTKGRSAF